MCSLSQSNRNDIRTFVTCNVENNNSFCNNEKTVSNSYISNDGYSLEVILEDYSISYKRIGKNKYYSILNDSYLYTNENVLFIANKYERYALVLKK